MCIEWSPIQMHLLYFLLISSFDCLWIVKSAFRIKWHMCVLIQKFHVMKCRDERWDHIWSYSYSVIYVVRCSVLAAESRIPTLASNTWLIMTPRQFSLWTTSTEAYFSNFRKLDVALLLPLQSCDVQCMVRYGKSCLCIFPISICFKVALKPPVLLCFLFM